MDRLEKTEGNRPTGEDGRAVVSTREMSGRLEGGIVKINNHLLTCRLSFFSRRARAGVEVMGNRVDDDLRPQQACERDPSPSPSSLLPATCLLASDDVSFTPAGLEKVRVGGER